MYLRILKGLVFLLAVASLGKGQAPANPPVTYRVNTVAGIPWSATGPAQAPNVMLKTPFGIAIDKKGNIYVANYEMHSIRRIEPDGRVTTVAGDGVNATIVDTFNPEAAARRLSFPRAIATDGERFLYISEPNFNRIRRLNLETNEITTIIGGRGAGFSADGTIGTAAQLREVLGIAVDAQGDLIIAETGNHRIRRWTASTGVLTTLAGTGMAGFTGDEGAATSATLNRPSGVAVHPSGDIYFFDFENRRVRRIRSGTITTVAGTPTGTTAQGPGLQVNFQTSTGIALDREGANLYITDERSHRIFKMRVSDANVTLIAGTGQAGRAVEDVAASGAALFTPTNIAVDALGGILFADTNNHRIRRIGPDGIIKTLVGMSRFSLEGSVTPDRAVFDSPLSVRMESRGILIVADTGNCAIRSVVTNLVLVSAGVQGSCGIDRDINSAVMDRDRNLIGMSGSRGIVRYGAGAQTTVRGGNPGWGLILNNDETALNYVEQGRGWILNVSRTAILGTANPLMTFLISGSSGSGYLDGSAFAAKYNFPYAVAYNAANELFIADLGNFAIRRMRGGEVTTFARVNAPPQTIAVDTADRVWTGYPGYVFRFNNEGRVDFVLGPQIPATGFSPNGSAGAAIRFGSPLSLIAGRNGSLYYIDSSYNVIRQLTPVVIESLRIVDGDNQTGAPNGELKAPLRVRVMGADGAPLSGQIVLFQSAVFGNPVPVETDMNGIASLPLTLPPLAGAFTVTATITGLPVVTFNVSAGSPAQVSEVVADPAWGGATAKIASGSRIVVKGTGLGGESVRVLINGVAALEPKATADKVECIVPDGIAEGPAELVVETALGKSPAFPFEAVAKAPALLAPVAFRVNQKQFVSAKYVDEEVYAGPEGAVANVAMRAAKAGDRLVLTLAGVGIAAGPSAVVVRFGETDVAADIFPDAATGAHLLVVTVPEGLAVGEVALTIRVDDVAGTQELWTLIGPATPATSTAGVAARAGRLGRRAGVR